MDYFDVSSNHFEGSLESIPIASVYESEATTFKADVNRLSGPVSMSILNAFSNVNVLSGNVISCSTVPPDDPNYSTYDCGSHDLENSIYFWLTLAFVSIIFVCICTYYAPESFKKIQEQISKRDMMRSDEIKARIPHTMQYLYSLKRLVQATAVITAFVLGLTVVMYCSFKLGSASNLFSSHMYQYEFLVSGVFLKGPGPAFSLVFLHFLVVCLLLGVFYIVFVKDWSVMLLGGNTSISYELSQSHAKQANADGSNAFCSREMAMLKEPKEREDALRASATATTSMTTWLRCAFKTFAVLAYLMVSVLGNVGYIFLRAEVSSSQLFFVELTLLVMNFLLSHCFSAFVEFVFPGEPHSRHAAKLAVFLICFIEIVTPFIATLISDDRCFHEAIISPSPVKLSYSYDTCILYNSINGVITSCAESLVTERSLPFTPPFIYSGECRDAVLTNFLPVVIQSSAIKGFLYPLFVFFLTRNEKDLAAKVKLFGWLESDSLESYVLTASEMRISMARVWSSLLMLLTYGILSPYAAVAIGVSTIAQIYFLRANICRYFHLEQPSHNRSDAEEFDESCVWNSNLESYCRDSQPTVDAMLWPGVIMSSILFSFYVFDMAYDTNSLDLAAPLSCLVLTLMIIPPARFIFYHFKKRLEQQRDENMRHSTSVEIPEVMNPLSTSG